MGVQPTRKTSPSVCRAVWTRTTWATAYPQRGWQDWDEKKLKCHILPDAKDKVSTADFFQDGKRYQNEQRISTGDREETVGARAGLSNSPV